MIMTHDPNLSDVASLYTESLRTHGRAAKGVGWRDAESHLLRFEKLAQVIDRSRTHAVADLGCGYGAFHHYLIDVGIVPSAFIGYDISDAMLDEARRQAAPNSEFVKGAAVDRDVDYAFASGIFNVRFDRDEGDWRKHILATLDNLNERSKRGFAFNLLTSYVDWKEPHLFYGDPLDFFHHCKRNYSRFVTLVHDYPLWEWTIVVRK